MNILSASLTACLLASTFSAQVVTGPTVGGTTNAPTRTTHLGPAVRPKVTLFFDTASLHLGIGQVGLQSTGAFTLTNQGDSSVQIDSFEMLSANAGWSAEPASQALFPITLDANASILLAAAYYPSEGGPSKARLRVVTAVPTKQKQIEFTAGAYDDPGSEYRIDAGGLGLDVINEQNWTGDFGFTGGNANRFNAPWTDDSEVMTYQRAAASFGYALPVPGSGEYSVELLLGEGQYQAIGLRRFDIALEGQAVHTDLDLFDESGYGEPFSQEYRVAVTDGVLNLDFTATVGLACVAGIRVRAVGELTVTPDTYHFGALESGQSQSFAIQLDNPGALDATIESLRLALGPSGFPASYTVEIDGTTYPGYNETVTQLVGYTIPTGGTGTATVTFAPTEERYDAINLELVGDFGTRSILLTGLGGHAGDPFLHVVIDTERVYIDYDGDGHEDCILDGSTSHTHEPGHGITGYEWFVDGNSVSAFPVDSEPLGLGSYTLELEITDDNTPARTLIGVSTILVETPQRVPGVLVKYYDAAGVGAETLIDNLPANADFAEVVESPFVDGITSVGGSSFTGDVVVTLNTIGLLNDSDTYIVLPGGGSKRRLWVDGAPVMAPIFLTAGEHLFEMAFAVNNLDELPLIVHIFDSNGVQYLVPDSRHDQTALNPVLNSMPPSGSILGGNQIVLRGLGFFPDGQVTVNWGGVSLTAADFTTARPNEIRFVAPPQTAGTIDVSITTPIGTSNVRSYIYDPNGPVAMDFWTKHVLPIGDPTAATWGCDGRLYVMTISGVLGSFEFDDQHNPIDFQTYPGLFGLTNHYACGITTYPWEDPNGPVRLYVSHAKHYVNDGDPFPVFSPYTGQISVLEGPDFDTPMPLITKLPSSNHDHSLFGITFNNNGELLINLGGTTNAGVPDPAAGNLPESPISGTVTRAMIGAPNFDGEVHYADPAVGTLGEPNQIFGHTTTLTPNPDISILAYGVRNPYGNVFTTWGSLYSTDNGPNEGFGPESITLTTQGPHPQRQDRLMLIERGNFYGHPNRSRGRFDPRQASFHHLGEPAIPGVFTQAISALDSSTDGIFEYRSDTFGGQIRGNLLVQNWYSWISLVDLSDDKRSVESVSEFQWTGGLALTDSFGGAIMSLDFNNDSLRVLVPLDPTAPDLVCYDITPWRAPATGGSAFTIGGRGFGTIANTSVTVGGLAANLIEVSQRRIRGRIPFNPNPTTEMLDIEITVGSQIDVHENAFRYLLPIGTEPLVVESREAPPVTVGETLAEVVGSTLIVMGDATGNTQRFDLLERFWLSDGATRTYLGAGSASATIGGELFLFGGDTAPDKLQRYDVATDMWSAGADLPFSTTGAFAVAHGDVIFVGGGSVAGVASKIFGAYDPTTDMWTVLSDLPEGIAGASAGSDDDWLYVFGGDQGSGATNLVQRYDPIGAVWESSTLGAIAPMPNARSFAGRAAHYFGSFHISGGLDNLGSPLATVDTLETANDTQVWSTVSELSEARSHHGVVQLEAILYVVGGSSLGGSSQAFDAYRE